MERGDRRETEPDLTTFPGGLETYEAYLALRADLQDRIAHLPQTGQLPEDGPEVRLMTTLYLVDQKYPEFQARRRADEEAAAAAALTSGGITAQLLGGM